MEHKNRPKTSPKDFFMHLLNMVTLYITAVGFGRLLFVIINYYYPDIVEGYYPSDSFDSIRWAISSIIVAYPAYIFTSKYLFKTYKEDPEKRNLRVKSWLEYFTLFGTAVIILVSLMTVVYKFLGGEITMRFIWKVLTIVYIAGSIFTYYLYMVKDSLQKKQTMVIRVLLIVSTVVVLAGIVGGFLTHGSPATERARRIDQTRIDNLQYIQNEIVNFYSRTKKLPGSITELADSINVTFPTDPQTQKPYEYIISDDLNFSLCAVFEADKAPQPGTLQTPYYSGQYQNIYNQKFTKGRNCFPYKINPDLFKDVQPQPIIK